MTLDRSLIREVVKLTGLDSNFFHKGVISLERTRYKDVSSASFLPSFRFSISYKLKRSSCLHPLGKAGIFTLSKEDWNILVDAVAFHILNTIHGWGNAEYDYLRLRSPHLPVPDQFPTKKEIGMPDWAKELPLPTACSHSHLNEGELPMATEKRKFFEQRAFVEGNDISLMSNEDIFSRITEQEKRINNLKGIKSQPTVLLETIATMESELDAFVKYLNSSK
jgi:hypothetical protein